MNVTTDYAFFVQSSSSRIESGDVSGVDGKSNGKGGRSWMEALASALGGMLGDRVMKITDAMNQMSEHHGASTDPKSDPEGAKAYMEAMTQFQVQSQLFGMESNAASTSIKSIGEGLVGLARKQ